jgi:hypothetical protein
MTEPIPVAGDGATPARRGNAPGSPIREWHRGYSTRPSGRMMAMAVTEITVSITDQDLTV